MTEQQELTLQRAIDLHGSEHQIDKAIEELVELLHALIEFKKGGAILDNALVRDVQDETADVTIMMHQLALLFGTEQVQERVDFKIERLARRLDRWPG